MRTLRIWSAFLFGGILIMVGGCMGTKEVTKTEFEERG